MWIAGLLVAGGWVLAVGEPVEARAYEGAVPGPKGAAAVRPWPGIGCWFWSAEEFEPEGYKRFLDLHARHSAFRLLTTSIRHPVEVTDPRVHDQLKAAAEYAESKGMSLVLDLDVRLARQAFLERYPDEMQELVRLREVPLSESGEAKLSIEAPALGDHYTFRARGYDSLSSRVLAVYSYVTGPDGIEPGTLEEITPRCRIDAAPEGVTVTVPGAAGDAGRTACALAAFRLFTPDVFAPHLVAFEREIAESYADVPLAGACKDEWGFPGRFKPRTDDLWYSEAMAQAYAERRPGRALSRDLLLMARGERGRESERIAAINHYMEMSRERNAAIEAAFYDTVKAVFGPEALVATHPTWYPSICAEEVFKNGLDWWAARRDLAQTDETTPFAARTALAKKWGSALWYNMYYAPAIEAYEQDLWRHVLGGGRMNFHPAWPVPAEGPRPSLLGTGVLRADCRARLLNLIAASPIDCPVAVVFGHVRALNWAGDGLGDGGLDLANRLWERGLYADLIPSSEIANGALRIADDGRVAYGVQRYEAVVLYGPQYERPEIAAFFRKAAEAGGSRLIRIGDWTQGFDGEAYDGNGELPAGMAALDVDACVARVAEELAGRGIEPQTACEPQGLHGFPESMMPRRSGRCRLIDGTVIRVSGERDVLGDPIRETVKVNGRDVSFDAVGVAAVRLDERGQVEAVAAGALRSFTGPGLSIELETPVDLALWRASGGWQGVVQGIEGPIPEALTRITPDWTRLHVPEPME
jgi:hypothetical protein